jgi:predicted nucleic acid-binding protein
VRALADTSMFIAREQGRELAGETIDELPEELVVSVVTVAELRLGVLMAGTVQTRAQRLDTLRLVESLEPLPVDDTVASAWARMVAELRAAGRRAPLNDSWIAATAIAHRIPVVTQDGDYDSFPWLTVVRL